MKKSLKQLDITVDGLYNGDYQIEVHLSDKPFVFNLIMVGLDKTPDFKLSSFGANIWVRSNKGINREKYKTLSSIQTQITRLINSRIDTDGDISFKLSNEIFTF